jgi:uncharacterized protein YraI
MRYTSKIIAFAICAGLATFSPVGAGSVLTQRKAGTARVSPCDAEAYVNDPDPRGMNVRSGPGSEYPVIGNLPNQDVDGIGVHLTGSRGDWVRIDRAVEQGGYQERVLFKGEGWVFGPLLNVDGVGGLGDGSPLFREPVAKGRVLIRVPVDGGGATVRGCRGRWLYVEHKGVKGWAAPGTLCSNALTNCS